MFLMRNYHICLQQLAAVAAAAAVVVVAVVVVACCCCCSFAFFAAGVAVVVVFEFASELIVLTLSDAVHAFIHSSIRSFIHFLFLHASPKILVSHNA